LLRGLKHRLASSKFFSLKSFYLSSKQLLSFGIRVLIFGLHPLFSGEPLRLSESSYLAFELLSIKALQHSISGSQRFPSLYEVPVPIPALHHNSFHVRGSSVSSARTSVRRLHRASQRQPGHMPAQRQLHYLSSASH
jgi:hypothetical protein